MYRPRLRARSPFTEVERKASWSAPNQSGLRPALRIALPDAYRLRLSIALCDADKPANDCPSIFRIIGRPPPPPPMSDRARPPPAKRGMGGSTALAMLAKPPDAKLGILNVPWFKPPSVVQHFVMAGTCPGMTSFGIKAHSPASLSVKHLKAGRALRFPGSAPASVRPGRRRRHRT